MGNERRFVILCHLSEREHSVTELCGLVGLSQSALSQHLAKLRRDNLVKTRRSAQTIFYSIASPDVGPILHSLGRIFIGGAAAGSNDGPETAAEKPTYGGAADTRTNWHKSTA